jgi:ABC-2 type transport system permease protein
MLHAFNAFLIRTSSFIRKEIFEILRQPMLVVTLILGPFLILLFFGIGYRNEAQVLRTLFVVQEGDPIADQIERYASTLGPQLQTTGIITSMAQAEERLQQGQVDLIVRAPDNAYQKILNNEQAVFELSHTKIDPIQTEYVNIFGKVYVDAVNRRVLQFITSQGQTNAIDAQSKIQTVRQSALSLQDLLERCATLIRDSDESALLTTNNDCTSENVQAYVQDLENSIDDLNLTVDDTARLIDALRESLGATQAEALGLPDEVLLSQSLNKLIQEANNLGNFSSTLGGYVDSLQLLTALQGDLENIDRILNQFLEVRPSVLVTPFRSETRSVARIVPTSSEYYTPPVIALLLQHLAITFAALSMVRERALGTMELFFVAPISALETLLGKYLSYLLFGSVLAIILFLLTVFGIKTPMMGQWIDIALVTLALIFTSLGYGFGISLISKTDIQAVQYSMIVLLTSVFFSGFIVGLETLWTYVQIISWVIPATYANVLLRDIMLRGNPTDWHYFFSLLGIGVAMFGLAWFLLRRSMLHSNA